MEKNITYPPLQSHIKLHPELYIGRPGDGSTREDGLYLLARKLIESNLRVNPLPSIEITIENQLVTISDDSPFIDTERLVELVSERRSAIGDNNYDFDFVGYFALGASTVNLLSSSFTARMVKGTECKTAVFVKGKLISVTDEEVEYRPYLTEISFIPDAAIFGNYSYIDEFVEEMVRGYVYTNPGLKITYNGKLFQAREGLVDLVHQHLWFDKPAYPVINLSLPGFDCAFTNIKDARSSSCETYFFENGANSSSGDHHIKAFHEGLTKAINDYFKRDFKPREVLKSFIGALSIKTSKPLHLYQPDTTRLRAQVIHPLARTLEEFVKEELPKYLDDHPAIAKALLKQLTG